MVRSEVSPDRGDIVWLSFDPQTGHEQKGRRPAIVLSDQVKSLDWRASNAAIVCSLSDEIVSEVFKKLKLLLTHPEE